MRRFPSFPFSHFFVFCGVLLAALLAGAAGAEDIFAPYLNDTPPEIVEVMKEYTAEGVQVKKLRFLSRTIPNSADKVICFGILARPASGTGPRPGVLVCHGGGASAEGVSAAVIGWAKRGYVSFCQDEPGIGPEKVQPNTSGPWTKNKWDRFTVDPDPTCSIIYDAVVSGLNGLRLLRSQPDVDKGRIGVTGGSWGGYMTTMVTGLAGDRVKASFAIYGCGFYELGSAWTTSLMGMPAEKRQLWLDNIDAGRRADGMRAAWFVTPATNDWFFWPNAVMATFERIPSPKAMAWSPNDSHVITFPGGGKGPQQYDTKAHRTYMEILWMDYHLKGEGQPFPVCAPEEKATRAGGEVEVRFRATGPLPLKNVCVYHSFGEQPWRMRWWERVEAKAAGDGVYAARVPVYEPGQAVNWFGYVNDSRDITVTTTMCEFQPSSLGFGATDRVEHSFAEDFEAQGIEKRWTIPYPDRSSFQKRGAKFSVTGAAAHGGKRGLLLQNDIMTEGNGFRAASAALDGTKGVAFWVRSPGGTGFRVFVRGEEATGRRHEWYASVANPGADWKRVEVAWSDFKYSGSGKAPMEMLSAGVGHLGFRGAEKAEIHVDDVALMK